MHIKLDTTKWRGCVRFTFSVKYLVIFVILCVCKCLPNIIAGMEIIRTLIDDLTASLSISGKTVCIDYTYTNHWSFTSNIKSYSCKILIIDNVTEYRRPYSNQDLKKSQNVLAHVLIWSLDMQHVLHAWKNGEDLMVRNYELEKSKWWKEDLWSKLKR